MAAVVAAAPCAPAPAHRHEKWGIISKPAASARCIDSFTFMPHAQPPCTDHSGVMTACTGDPNQRKVGRCNTRLCGSGAPAAAAPALVHLKLTAQGLVLLPQPLHLCLQRPNTGGHSGRRRDNAIAAPSSAPGQRHGCLLQQDAGGKPLTRVVKSRL
jgi:hypothetical protein